MMNSRKQLVARKFCFATKKTRSLIDSYELVSKGRGWGKFWEERVGNPTGYPRLSGGWMDGWSSPCTIRHYSVRRGDWRRRRTYANDNKIEERVFCWREKEGLKWDRKRLGIPLQCRPTDRQTERREMNREATGD